MVENDTAVAPAELEPISDQVDAIIEDEEFFVDIFRRLLGAEDDLIAIADDDFEEDVGLEPQFESYCIRCLKERSANKYRNRVMNYKHHCRENELNEADPQSILSYMDFMRQELEYLSSTIWSAVVILCTWFSHVHLIRAMDKAPLIKGQLKKWAEKDDVTQAKAFTAEEIEKFLVEAPDDETHLVRKAAHIYGVHGLCRKSEIVAAKTGYLVDKGDMFIGTIDRVKTVGRKIKQTFVIKEKLYYETLKKYLACFPAALLADKVTRLFRKVLKKRGKHVILILLESKLLGLTPLPNLAEI